MNGANKLATAFQNRMKEISDTPPAIDFGTIQADMSLLTNKFPLPIPQSDYMICRSVALGNVKDVLCKARLPKHRRKPNDDNTDAKSDDEIIVDDEDGEDEEIGKGDTDSEDERKHRHHRHRFCDVLISEKIRWLMPGDRVLVVWVGKDPCVVDLILPASTIT